MKLENPWWLDLALQGHSVGVEWRPGQGFGLSTGESGYGEGPDEVYSRAEEAEARLIELLEERKRQSPLSSIEETAVRRDRIRGGQPALRAATTSRIERIHHKMRIKRLGLANFKRFESLWVDLHPQFTVLLGDNGAGKTSILDALAVALSIWLIRAPDSTLSNSGRSIRPSEILLRGEPMGDRTVFREEGPAVVSVIGDVGDKLDLTWTRTLRSGSSRTSHRR